jgi:hypothetical protein
MQEGGEAEVEEGHRTESPLYVRRVYPLALSATVCVVVGRSVISICCPRSDYMISPSKTDVQLRAFWAQTSSRMSFFRFRAILVG